MPQHRTKGPSGLKRTDQNKGVFPSQRSEIKCWYLLSVCLGGQGIVSLITSLRMSYEDKELNPPATP